jgi:uncharacterized protein (DUF924 family)
MASEPRDILKFWFEEPKTPEAMMQLWFGGTAEIDAAIRARFETDVIAAAEGKYGAWVGAPDTCLALVILLDQFTLNIYRDQARSFEWNAKALPIALRAIEKGFDRRVSPLERVFYYLPLEHAEDLALQKQAVALFQRLVDETPEEMKEAMKAFHHYAVLHLEVIERFGRFPDRNPILGRPHTKEEAEYMAAGGPPF